MSKVKIYFEDDLNVEDINSRIDREICLQTIENLSDEKLMNKYKTYPSVKNKIIKLYSILNKYIDTELSNKIINEYISEIIPPGTKSVVRGNKFNLIVKNHILNLDLDKSRFSIQFEEIHKNFKTSEIPDWYIYDNINNKIMIGMNQIDLWSGGHQLNRFSKYIDIENNPNSKIVCVICKYIKFKSDTSKCYQMFKIGFENNTLCYINSLENIINNYFNNTIL